MELTISIDEVQLQKDLQSAADTKVNELTIKQIASWDLQRTIEFRVKEIFFEQLDSMIESAIKASGKTLDERVEKTLDALIKSKVKKAMK